MNLVAGRLRRLRWVGVRFDDLNVDMPVPFFTATLAAWRAAYADTPGKPASRLADAVVKLSIKAVADARTADTLRAEREGRGSLSTRSAASF